MSLSWFAPQLEAERVVLQIISCLNRKLAGETLVAIGTDKFENDFCGVKPIECQYPLESDFAALQCAQSP